jgi:Uma2 family endonuclease
MSVAVPPPVPVDLRPDHTQLPETDGKPVENSVEQHQNALLTECLLPVLAAKHPDGQFFIGQDVGIYYQHTDPPLDGCKAPDWFYVPNVSPEAADGTFRRSYVYWRELRPPLVIIEQASRGGDEERDATPGKGKFWVYQTVLQAPYYFIYDTMTERLEAYRQLELSYVPMEPNTRGRFEIPGLGVEVGLWPGEFHGLERTWVRFYDRRGRTLPTEKERADRAEERADREKERADREKERAEQERQKAQQEAAARAAAEGEAERLRALLAKLGVDPTQAP